MRRSDQPGAGKRANLRQTIQGYIRAAKRRPRTLGQNVFGAILDEVNFSGHRLTEWEPGMSVRLIKESAERLAGGELLPGQAAHCYGTVVRKLKKGGDAVRRAGGALTAKIVVRLVNGKDAVTDPWNLERVTTLDLLAAASDGE